MVYPFFFFTMKEGVTDAEYRITNRLGNTGRVNEKICKFPPKKKDEGFSWICRIFQSNHDLLNDNNMCSFEEHEAENVCFNKDAVSCGGIEAF